MPPGSKLLLCWLAFSLPCRTPRGAGLDGEGTFKKICV